MKELKKILNNAKNLVAYNTWLEKVVVQFSAETFVADQTLFLRINSSSENHHFHQARKLYRSLYDEHHKTNK